LKGNKEARKEVVRMMSSKRLFLFTGFLVLILMAVPPMESQAAKKGGRKMIITSPAFKEGGMIPAKYTCDAQDISPPLEWNKVPAGTKSLALICDDPDAVVGTWVHWVVYNIPPDASKLDENIKGEREFSNGMIQGSNDWPRIGYGGPCPPSGTHRYFFKLYALDALLDLKPGATKAQVLKAMKGHVLAEAQLMGRYKRQGR
jgi:Raf kinase inhibitor-like YbhB/YbcL family protein